MGASQLVASRTVSHGGAVGFDDAHFQVHEARIESTPSLPIPIVVGGRAEAA